MKDDQDIERYTSLVLVKETLIKKLSQEQQIPLATVKAVIDNEFKTAAKAISTCNSIEIAGFGKFMFRKNRAKVYIKICEKGASNYKEALDNPDGQLTEMKKEGLLVRLKNITELIKYLTDKINKV